MIGFEVSVTDGFRVFVVVAFSSTSRCQEYNCSSSSEAKDPGVKGDLAAASADIHT